MNENNSKNFENNDEINNENNNIENIINYFNTEIIKNLENKITDLNNIIKNKIKREKENAKKINDLKIENESLKNELKFFKDQQLILNNNNENNNENILNLNAHDLTNIDKQIEEINKLNSEKEDELNKIIEEGKIDSNSIINKINEEENHKLNQKLNEINNKLILKENEINEKNIELNNKINEINDLKKEIEKIKNENNFNEENFNLINKKNSEEIIKIKNSFNEEINKLKLNNQNEILNLKKENSEKIINLNNEKNIEINKLKTLTNEQKLQIEKIISEHENKLNSIKIEYENKFKNLTNEQISLKNSEINKINDSFNEIQTQNFSYSNEIISLKEKISLLSKKIDDSNNEILLLKENPEINNSKIFKELLTDYFFCLYLYESGITIQNLTENVLDNLGNFLNFGFNNGQNNCNFPINNPLYEFIEDIYFLAFDKLISKKLFLSGMDFNDTKKDPNFFKINYEDFNEETIIEITFELLNKNAISRIKKPKKLENLINSFLKIYKKNFVLNDIEILIKNEILPQVQNKIEKYNKNILNDMKTFVDIALKHIKNGKIYNENIEIYSFEKYYNQYNHYKNLTERNLKIVLTDDLSRDDTIDNILHTFKYYFPKIIKFHNCFNLFENDHGTNISLILKTLNKFFAALTSYQNNLNQLDIISNNFNNMIFNFKIIPSLKLLKNLENLDLSDNNLNDVDVKNLSEFLQNSKLKILIMNNNKITSNGGYYLADALIKNETLEVLHLNHNKINDKGFSSIIYFLNNSKKLIDLDISYNDLLKDDLIKLSEFLEKNPILKILNLSGNKIDSVSANFIGCSLAKNKNLLELKVNKCDLNEENIPQFVNYINETNLNILQLDENVFGTMGPIIVMNKIKNCSSLKFLSLRYCKVSPMFLKMIGETIKFHNNIETIDLSFNNIENESFIKFCDEIKNNQKLIVKVSKSMLNNQIQEIVKNYKNIKME